PDNRVVPDGAIIAHDDLAHDDGRFCQKAVFPESRCETPDGTDKCHFVLFFCQSSTSGNLFSNRGRGQICLTRCHGKRLKVCIFASLKCVFMEDLLGDIGFYEKAGTAAEPGITRESHTGKQRKLYIESYGCQMNFSDSEIVASILAKEGFDTTSDIANADVVFLNTCAIREKAEQTVRNRLDHIQG